LIQVNAARRWRAFDKPALGAHNPFRKTREDGMSERFKVACIQNRAGPETAPNLETCAGLVRQAAGDGARFICLPEYFAGLDVNGDVLVTEAFPEERHPALPMFGDLAREFHAWILLGSLAIEAGERKVFNRSYLLGPDGAVAARYDKIHLYDVDLEDGESYRESATIVPGDKGVTADLPWGRLGLSICYDVRFAYLYRALAHAGADFLTIPAAFTETTGKAHWHVLVRARAIETGAYVFAPCQYGGHVGGGASYGHSLIVDPWGRVLADGGDGPGYIVAEVDPAEVRKARAMVPALTHDRPFAPPERESLRAVGDD
jgi:predicted amidohydrolase